MKQLALDPCLMYKRNNQQLVGMMVLQVDATLYASDADFTKLKEETSSTFPSKGRTPLGEEVTLFNVLELTIEGEDAKMPQKDYITAIPRLASKSSMTF